MTIRPILFSAPMVRAIQREIKHPGTGKTQTRRILKPQPVRHHWRNFGSYSLSPVILDTSRGRAARFKHSFTEPAAQDEEFEEFVMLRFSPGDVLWVRETWCTGPIGRDGVVEDWSDFIYRASSPEVEGVDDGDGYAELNADGSIKSCWKPSIHMPRKASRLTLAVTDVRVERLQDISEDDAKAEGCGLYVPGHGFITYDELAGDPGYSNFLAPRMGFEAIWTEINGPKSWAENPWVVAVSFIPHAMNVDAFLAQREAA